MKNSKKIAFIVLSMLFIFVLGIVMGKNWEAHIREVVLIQGENEDWRLEGFQILKYEKKIQHGNGKIVYKGNEDIFKDVSGMEIAIEKISSGNDAKKETLDYDAISGGNFKWIKKEVVNESTVSQTYEKALKNYVGNLSAKEKVKYNLNEGDLVTASIKIQYLDGKKIEVTFPLEVIVANNRSFEQLDIVFDNK